MNTITTRYTFIDYATQGYVALVGLLVFIFHGDTVAHWPTVVLAHAGCLVLVHLLIRCHIAFPRNWVVEFLRSFYPVILYTYFYHETGSINRMFIPEYLDPFFIRLEGRLFGFQPSQVFMEKLPYLAVSELLYFSYFCYYIMIVGIGVALFFRDRAQFFHYVSVISFVFYCCFLLYVLLPVIGPRVFFRDEAGYRLPEQFQMLESVVEYPASVQSGLFCRIMAIIYRNFEAPGAAFPSSHVAVSLCTLYFSFRYLPRIRHVHLIIVILLCISTVYCHYHYVVDVVAGAMTTAILLPLGNHFYRRFMAGGN